mmetsp:Transcript_19952/g.28254  ORF Transcript_19952/g.28254 Transcript_19952/m.28254 type:complete len:373 (+) Transcript_19952:237-1355(+)
MLSRSFIQTFLTIAGFLSTSSAISWCSSKTTSFKTDSSLIAGSHCLLRNIRGGSTSIIHGDEEVENSVNPEEEKKRLAARKWRTDQQNLMQLRSFVLSEVLAKRGIPMPTLLDVSTAEGDKPPEKVDWDCALSTEEDSKSCLYSFDAEPNTKVVAPLGTDQWITLTALNRLRRTDPTKVEPMWHSQFSILQSWFGDDSEYSILQHVGLKGFLITLLLDSANGALLKALLVMGVLSTLVIVMPVLEFVFNRMLVSGQFWNQWPTWGRIVHAALPLKLLIGQMVWKFMASSFGALETKVRDYIVDLECAMLEESTPLTVGVETAEDITDEQGAWDDEEVVPTTETDDDADHATMDEDDIDVYDDEDEYDSDGGW